MKDYHLTQQSQSYYSNALSGIESLLQNLNVHEANGPVETSTGVLKEVRYILVITLL